MRLSISTFLLAIGCYSRASFVDELEGPFCAWDQGCAEPYYDDADDCAARFADEICGAYYDARPARECVAALTGLPCEGDHENYPDECRQDDVPVPHGCQVGAPER